MIFVCWPDHNCQLQNKTNQNEYEPKKEVTFPTYWRHKSLSPPPPLWVCLSNDYTRQQHNMECLKELKMSLQIFLKFHFNRVICKIRKSQHQHPQFGHHTHGEIKKKKPAKKCISIQLGMKLRKPSILVLLNWVSSCRSFFLSAASTTDATSIFTAPICTTTIISLEACLRTALVSGISYWDLMKCLLLCGYHWKRG